MGAEWSTKAGVSTSAASTLCSVSPDVQAIAEQRSATTRQWLCDSPVPRACRGAKVVRLVRLTGGSNVLRWRRPIDPLGSPRPDGPIASMGRLERPPPSLSTHDCVTSHTAASRVSTAVSQPQVARTL